MGFTILLRRHVYIESDPRSYCWVPATNSRQCTCWNFLASLNTVLKIPPSPPPPPPLVPHICISESDQHWCRWLVAYSPPSHHLNQCWVIVNWTLKNKLQWNFNQNSKRFTHENRYKIIVCEMAAILSREMSQKEAMGILVIWAAMWRNYYMFHSFFWQLWRQRRKNR